MSMCVYVHVSEEAWEGQQAVLDAPEAGVTGSCELCNVSAGD